MDIFVFSVVIVRLPYSMSAIYLLSVEKMSKLVSLVEMKGSIFYTFPPLPPTKMLPLPLCPYFVAPIGPTFL